MSGPAGTTLAVIGVGQIGGSVALAARAAGVCERVVGWNRNPATLARARDLGVIDEAAPSAAAAVRSAAVVILAVPVRALPAVLEAVAGALAPGALVMDVGSVKAPVLSALETRLPPGRRLMGCHPIAGTERAGPEAADGRLFAGRPCILCPSRAAVAADVEEAATFWRALGAHPRVLDAELHDAVFAASSHLPHVAAYSVAVALRSVAPEVGALLPELAGSSLRDVTRVAGSSPAMWRDIWLHNRERLLPLVAALEESIGELRAAIERGDDAAIEAFLEAGVAERRRIFGD